VLWVDCGDEAVPAPWPEGWSAGAAGRIEGLAVQRMRGLAACVGRSAGDDALVLALPSAQAALAWPALLATCAELAVLTWLPACDAESAAQLLQAGVQDVVLHAHAASLHQRTLLAVERKRIERELNRAHATDLMTGLPNRAQLIEHMSQLLALREREPKPVSLLVLRVDGLDAVAAGHGEESANVARRKVAVRLRAGVRASDVVAAISPNVFAVLLPSMESAADAQHVVDKLTRAVHEPVKVAGNPVGLTACVGTAQFPQDGKQPEALLRHASAAALLGAVSRQGAAND
jgi:diguanylate cyclase (GGDEF)-like protein